MNRGALIAFGRRQPTQADCAYPLGAPRLAGTGRILTVEGDEEWLAGSWSVVYEAKYADLMAQAPHMLCADATSLKTLTLSQDEESSARISARLFWSATAAKYLLVGIGSANAAPASEYAVGATIATLAESTYPSNSNGVMAAAQFGDGSVVTVHGSTGLNQGTRFPGATFTPASVQPTPVVNCGFIAANGANGVAFGLSSASNTANAIGTSADNGATWTNRTGTSGAIPSGQTRGLAWCPAGSVWLQFGHSDGFGLVGTVLSSPDGYTHTLRYDASGWTPGLDTSKLLSSHRAASSSTVTLLAGEARTLLRTTDGVTFTPIQPEVLAGYQLAANNAAAFALAVARDPASGYFYCFNPDASHIPDQGVDGAAAVTVLRSTNGLDWEPCIGFLPRATAVKLRSIEFANGQVVAAISETTDQITGLLDVSAVLSRTPSTVRAPADPPATGFNAQWRIK